MRATSDPGQGAPALGPLPPHGVIDNFLPDADRKALVDWAIGQEAAFRPAQVFYGEGGHQQQVNLEIRIALKHCGVGPFEPLIRQQLKLRMAAIASAAGYTGPHPASIEFELNAYGDGAHFAPHIDIPTGADRRSVGYAKGEDRVISAVFYFFHEPKGFTGGALRIYRFGADPHDCGPDDRVALEPVQNRLVIFPSWARHGVEQVQCPSGEFTDYRFALNCWFCRKLGG
jgi:Rps23 Pro-64 3,4-dihydroxylase Tpa1-like proline 4-hydroxylase